MLILFQQLISPKNTSPIPWSSRLPKCSHFSTGLGTELLFPVYIWEENLSYVLRLSVPYLTWICRDQYLDKLMSLHNHNAAGDKLELKLYQSPFHGCRMQKNQKLENQVHFKSNMTKLSIGRTVMFYDTQQLTEAEIWTVYKLVLIIKSGKQWQNGCKIIFITAYPGSCSVK